MQQVMDGCLDIVGAVKEGGTAVPSEHQKNGAGLARFGLPHGTLQWDNRCSLKLQEVIDHFQIDQLCSLNFSVTVADPTQLGCPIVACSAGFMELTGYDVPEIVGRNCSFLLHGVPSILLDQDVQTQCRDFCFAASRGELYCGASENIPAGMQKPLAMLPDGEIICAQTNARKSGELFTNLFYLKQVELNQNPFILGLQAELPETCVPYKEATALAEMDEAFQQVFKRLDQNMAVIEQVLTQEFWYSAPMRRQV